MKKILFLLLALLLIFGGCARHNPSKSAEEIAGKIKQNLSIPGEMLPADTDYLKLNFSEVPAPESYAVYVSDTSPVSELGVFCMQSTADAAKMLVAVQEYLQSESEAKNSLAALYPSEAASKECDHYRNAESAAAGTVVYYFAGESANLKVARSAFETAS